MEEQTKQWPKEEEQTTMAKRRTDNTMVKRRTDNTMVKRKQTIQWSKENRQYNGSVLLLTIVLSVFF
jgi:hypothetical protein